MHAEFRTPIVVSELGADTISGVHADPPEMFSEEYQALFFERYIQVMVVREILPKEQDSGSQ